MGMLPAYEKQTGVLSEINITPFTDVLLVLLIIFMILASLTTPPGFERELPGGCNKRLLKPPPYINVTVSKAGTIFVGSRRTSVSALYPRLASLHAHAPRNALALSADVKAPYAAVIRVLDAAKAGGIENVSLVVE